MDRFRTLIMGAAGRDFHNFNVVYRDDPRYEVVGFTAAQIPNIADRRYPRELAGPLYPEGIPIFDEHELAALIDRLSVRQVVFSYSDVAYVYVMHRAAIANAAGADFVLLGPDRTMLKSRKPVVAVCAVRTGAGTVIARKLGAREIVDPRPFAVGSLAETFRTYPAIGPLLPAMGYGEDQVRDLEATIDRVPCDVVVVGTPIDLSRLVTIRKPVVRVRYELQEIGQPDLAQVITNFLGRLSIPAPPCTRHGKVMAMADGDREC